MRILEQLLICWRKRICINFTSEIAKRAEGVAEGTIFRYYKTKDFISSHAATLTKLLRIFVQAFAKYTKSQYESYEGLLRIYS